MEEKKKITVEKHKERHVHLHEALDELIADFLLHTKKMPSKSTIMQLMKWSHEQTTNPTTIPKEIKDEK